jgi:hypothetical protein
MGAWFHRWIVVDFYDPVWPNIAAAGVCAAFTISRVKTHMRNHHETMRAEIEKLRKLL